MEIIPAGLDIESRLAALQQEAVGVLVADFDPRIVERAAVQLDEDRVALSELGHRRIEIDDDDGLDLMVLQHLADY